MNANHAPQASNESYNFVRLALPMMSRYNVAATPQNYSVWYAYVSGLSSELCGIIDAMIEKGEPFTDATNEMLYHRFGLADAISASDSLREELKRTLVTILFKLSEFCGQTGQYETTLSRFIEGIAPDATYDEIKGRFDEVIADTKAMGDMSKAIQNTLEQKNEELNVLRQEFEQVRKEASIDFLTGVSNRKAFDEMLTQSMADSDAKTNDLCLLMIDIDHFKQFNDQHGHIIGDEVLRFVARKIKEIVRGTDFVARYGGEEFSVILPKTDLQGAKTVAENLRAFFSDAILKSASSSAKLGKITISIGMAAYRSGETPENFIKRADKALYSAKSKGRNRAEVELGSNN